MTKLVCDHCGKDVNQYNEGAITGDCDLTVCLGMSKTHSWRNLLRGKTRHAVEDRGAWCGVECFFAWLKSQVI